MATKDTIICKETGIEIRVDRTNGGKGRINSIRVYDTNKKLQVITNIYLNGNEIETKKLKQTV